MQETAHNHIRLTIQLKHTWRQGGIEGWLIFKITQQIYRIYLSDYPSFDFRFRSVGQSC